MPFFGVSVAEKTLFCLKWMLCRDLSVGEMILFCTDHLAFIPTSYTLAYPDSWAFAFLARGRLGRLDRLDPRLGAKVL